EQPVDDARQRKVEVMKRACRNEAPGACRTEEHPETEHPGKIHQDRPALLRSCLAGRTGRPFSSLRDHSAKPESMVVVVAHALQARVLRCAGISRIRPKEPGGCTGSRSKA